MAENWDSLINFVLYHRDKYALRLLTHFSTKWSDTFRSFLYMEMKKEMS